MFWRKKREQKTAKERNRYDMDEYLDEKVSLFNVRRVLGYLIKAQGPLKLSLFFSILASLAGLVGPLFIKRALDEAVLITYLGAGGSYADARPAISRS